jgi:hypothetical protein
LRSIGAHNDLLNKCQQLVDGFEESNLDDITTFIRDRAEVLVNFAPFGRPWDEDWKEEWDGELRSGETKSLLQRLTEDETGRYKTQFETSTSGGLNDQGRRREVERRMFGDAYDVDHSAEGAGGSLSSSSSSSSSSPCAVETNPSIDKLRPKYG